MRELSASKLNVSKLNAREISASDTQIEEANEASAEVIEEGIEELRVTASRYERTLKQLIGNNSALNESDIKKVEPQHPTEILQRLSGVWLSRGNGQESLMAIRSPVLTGAGSCEAFLIMEHGIPVRAPGFCNVNQMFDLNLEQAASIELVAGTASSLYGSRALHGALNIGQPTTQNSVSFQTGANEYQRLGGVFNSEDQSISLAANIAHDGGFKDESGFDQQKFNFVYRSELGAWTNQTHLGMSNIEQETAGYLQQGEDAYKDSRLAKTNEFPEAYRDARSLRISSQFKKTNGNNESLVITPYARKNEMEFLMHFLPGQPVEENGHQSLGIQVQSISSVYDNQLTLQTGVDGEVTDGFLNQSQSSPTQTGSNFLNEVLAFGNQYDFQIQASQLAGYGALEWELASNLRLNTSIRYDWIQYDYRNQLDDGNLKNDGTPCGFGGCRYTRPGDQVDEFNNWSNSIGGLYDLNSNHTIYLKYDRGFRAPHTSELYRLQNGQLNSNVKSEFARSAELGYRYFGDDSKVAAQFYWMEKENVIIQNSDREYLNGAETRHKGLELSFETKLSETISLAAATSFSDHVYQNQPQLLGTSVNIKGNQIDTAPNRIANLNLNYQIFSDVLANLEWQYLSNYYLNPDNTESYAGHRLYNLKVNWQAASTLSANLHILNLTNQDYAERADFAFGNHRYFVGEPRRLMVSVNWQY